MEERRLLRGKENVCVWWGMGTGRSQRGESAVSMTFGNESLLKCTSYLSHRETLIKARRGLFLRRGCWRRWRRRWRRRSLRRGRERLHRQRQHCLSSWGTSQRRRGKFHRLHRGTSLTHQRQSSTHPLDIITYLQKRAYRWHSESPLSNNNLMVGKMLHQYI